MSQETLKSFGPLHQDYAFFEAHASEMEATLSAWLPLVQGRWSEVRALDFGAGSGSFTSQFLARAGFPPESLQLTLVEPDEGFRAQAQTILARFTSHPIQAWPLLDRDTTPTFDLIFSHHVLYYVPNLRQTLERLVNALKSGGLMMLVQAGRRNDLNRLVFAAFDLMGEPSPYNYSEDTAAALEHLGVLARVEDIPSTVNFADSTEARWRILRFLLADHVGKLAPEVALGLFEPFLRGDRVHFENHDQLFIIER